jgi:hypothetical protein
MPCISCFERKIEKKTPLIVGALAMNYSILIVMVNASSWRMASSP